jgi:hypothetical protein
MKRQVDRTRPAMQSATRYVMAAHMMPLFAFTMSQISESDAAAELGEVSV